MSKWALALLFRTQLTVLAALYPFKYFIALLMFLPRYLVAALYIGFVIAVWACSAALTKDET